LVIEETVLNVPFTVFFTNEPVPFTIPNPPSIGPFYIPLTGISTKSLTPFPIFLNRPTGFPIILEEPSNLNIFF